MRDDQPGRLSLAGSFAGVLGAVVHLRVPGGSLGALGLAQQHVAPCGEPSEFAHGAVSPE
ncbi:hypothetical protein ABZ734_33615 [Streptomyces sp. NPDC006660]|uniref:hypothetical protein n=1 Tax=Streptomyces sp. NPDC006660 TaxID=3156901 RepID=UPI003406940A